MKSAVTVVIITGVVALLAGCATARGPRQVETELPGDADPTWNWSRVGEVVPGTEVVMTVKGSQPGSRVFVSADESALTVLNLTEPALPAVSARVLRDMASHHPGYFAAMQRGGTFAEDKVRVGRDGVFVADRKVAELGRVVETIARNDITEITGPVVAPGSVLGAVLGGWIGFAVGVVPALGGAPGGLAWPLLIGSVAAGGFLGSHWSSHETEDVIFRAP